MDQADQFVVFASDNDHVDIQNSVELLKDKIPKAKYRNFHDYGHFCYKDLKTDAFPELLEEILS